MIYDAIVIGGGAVGCATARELSRYDLRLALCEKHEDVCAGTSKANSAIVHAGFDAVPGTQKAHFNVAGSRMMEGLSRELDFSYRRNGALVLCFNQKDLPGWRSCGNGARRTAWRVCALLAETSCTPWRALCPRRRWRLCTPPPAPLSVPSA